MQALLPYLQAAQILVSILLVALILMQARGTGFAAGYAADSSIHRTRRGVERMVFQLTIVVGVVFVLLSILSVLAPRFEA
ncbi:MAG: preprotein translocase subunit SecG [Chloroflexi bacterium]|nr:preprotein translocase subunit SecG [Chloroflexota bacterium]